MQAQVILSCPFCHHRAEYQDAPPGSTVRCHECGSIFRVPAMKQRKPGTVVKGEQIRSSKKKLILWLVVLVIVAGGAWCAWAKYRQPNEVVTDRFARVKGIWPEESAYGTLQRFLLSWQQGHMDWLVEYCRLENQPPEDDTEFAGWLASMFGNVRLVRYDAPQEKPLNPFVMEYRVHIVGVDTRTSVEQKGSMSPRVMLEKTPEGKERWGVDVQSAVPRWE